MNPTDLPDLAKPNFSGSNRRKTAKLETTVSTKKSKKINDYFCVSVNKLKKACPNTLCVECSSVSDPIIGADCYSML